MRSISRMTGVSINTVSKLLVDAGKACSAYHDEAVRDVKASGYAIAAAILVSTVVIAYAMRFEVEGTSSGALVHDRWFGTVELCNIRIRAGEDRGTECRQT